jgi:two-component system sensor histidine kinase GlrK
MKLQQASLRQWLLLAFLLIGLLPGAAALRALFTLESLMAQSDDAAMRAIELSTAAQALTERSLSMERAARQSLVLGDAQLRRRFDDAARDARAVLDTLVENDLPADRARVWRAQVVAIASQLDGPAETALDRERVVAQEFRELDAVNAGIGQQVQQVIARRNQALADRLRSSQRQLAQQVGAALVIAVALALALGVWLARPFKRLERAIVGLGQNQLDRPIDIAGPSDLRRVSQQLEWLRLRLTELDADKARFLRHVSHELKTPLAALREGVSLLRDGVTGELTPGQREVVQILQANTSSLQSQIEALLRFNTAAFEARQLRRARTDLLQLLEQQVESQRLQWQARGLRVQVDGDPIELLVDPDKLGMALANLLSNAIRFSPPGGLIRWNVTRLAEGVRIDITDAGPGVARADRARIFEPFYRGERQPEDAVRGTGIGLSIVQEYIAAHGGRIELVPASVGAHFRIELPHGL